MPPTNIKQGASSQASAYCKRGTHTVSHQAEVLQVLSYLTVPETDVPHTQTGTHLQDVTNLQQESILKMVIIRKICLLWRFLNKSAPCISLDHPVLGSMKDARTTRCLSFGRSAHRALPLTPIPLPAPGGTQAVHPDPAWGTREPEGRHGTWSYMCHSIASCSLRQQQT